MFPDDPTDLQCMDGIASGQHEALAALYDRYSGLLFALIDAMLGPSSEAEELLHDVFLGIWRDAATFRPEQSSVYSWLVLRTRDAALEQLQFAPELACMGQNQTLLPSDWEPSARCDLRIMDDRAFGHQRLQVQHAIGSLSAGLRQTLEVPFFQGGNLNELSAQMRTTSDDLLQNLAHAYEALNYSLHESRRT